MLLLFPSLTARPGIVSGPSFMRDRLRTRNGFTLIEALVAISIMALWKSKEPVAESAPPTAVAAFPACDPSDWPSVPVSIWSLSMTQ